MVAEDPAVERRHRDVDARRAEVGDEDVAAVGAERQLARRAAPGARPDVSLADEAALDQLADALGDDGPPEPGPGHQLRSGERPAEPDLVEDLTSASSASSGSGRSGPHLAFARFRRRLTGRSCRFLGHPLGHPR